VTAQLDERLLAIRQRWLSLPRGQQDELYATQFADGFARLFAELPLHAAPPDFGRPRALVSVLGFSWQPVALMAAWAHPEQMLVIGTKESLAREVAGEGVLSLISRISGVARDTIRDIRVGDPGETDIYRAVRDLLRRVDLPSRQIFVDPTGGKKSMSSSASLAAFIAGAPLVYVDYAGYHGPHRIPVAGTEYPRLLANPLDVLGDLELRDIFAAFNRSDFVEAGHLAERLSTRLYEPREAECLALLAAGYGAWDRFDFQRAREALGTARYQVDRFAARGDWSWASAMRDVLEDNIGALDALVKIQVRPDSVEEGRALLGWYLSAARRLLGVEKPSLAVLLTYAAVERYIDLCLWADFGLDDENPDYASLHEELDRARYDEAGRRLFGSRYKARELEGPLMFGNGAQLLATLRPDRLGIGDLGVLAGISNARNKCEYEHGILPKIPSSDNLCRFLDRATDIVGRVGGDAGKLDEVLSACRFPRLTARS